MAKRKWKLRRNHGKTNWQNTGKEQMALTPTIASEDQVEEAEVDLKLHNPFRKQELDDKKPQKPVAKNKSATKTGQTDTMRWKTIRRQSKQMQFDVAKDEAKHAAALTDTKEDDKRADAMKPKDLEDYVFDDGVDDEIYTSKAWRKYLG